MGNHVVAHRSAAVEEWIMMFSAAGLVTEIMSIQQRKTSGYFAGVVARQRGKETFLPWDNVSPM